MVSLDSCFQVYQRRIPTILPTKHRSILASRRPILWGLHQVSSQGDFFSMDSLEPHIQWGTLSLFGAFHVIVGVIVGAIVGVGCFKMISRFHTTTNFTAEEIHALGIKEVIHFSPLLLQDTWFFVQHWSQVASIEEEMREVITELNLDLTVKEFVSKLRNDPANYFGSDSTLESP